MLSRFAKSLLVGSAAAPILLAWAFADWHRGGAALRQLVAVVVAVGLAALCALVLIGAKRYLPRVTYNATTLKTADVEVVGFLVAYMLPLVATGTDEFDYVVLGFVMVMVGVIVWATNAYAVNPLLSAVGYHFYETTSSGGVTSLLISRRTLHNCSEVSRVVQVTRYVVLDASD